MNYVKNIKNQNDTLSIKDVGSEMEKLRMKASEKICDFFYKKVEGLKTPNTNIAITQKSVLLKYKELYYFLLERYVDVAIEVKMNYVSVVGQFYLSSFDRYIKILQKFQTSISDKNDLLGGEENSKKSKLINVLAIY